MGADGNIAGAVGRMDDSVLLELVGLSKSYGGIRALQDVSLQARRGTVHALLGENGAGKSTLIKLMSGVIRPDLGTIALEGRVMDFASPRDAERQGIACVFQELSLLPELSVADNIFIASPPRRFGLIDTRRQISGARALLARMGCDDIDPRILVRDLPLARRQLIEICKAIAQGPRILILDEATSALPAKDAERVFRLVHDLRAEGCLVFLITHRMGEITALADTCSVFRNGSHVSTFAAGARSDAEIVRMMIGRDIEAVFPPKRPASPAAPGPATLEVSGLSWQDQLHDISMSVRAGEIVGIGGLEGQGQRELLLALFGVLRGTRGEVRLDGAPLRAASPRSAMAQAPGIALIPEDRKTEGLIPDMSIAENLSLASLGALSRFGFLDRHRERHRHRTFIEVLRIKVASADLPAGTLSGGNQQKVVIAKWLMTGARVILLNDPTRGIDVGTKQEIYALLRKLADDGAAIVLFSSDYAELVGCCDRVLVPYGGRIRAELSDDSITEEAIVAASLNLSAAGSAGLEGRE